MRHLASLSSFREMTFDLFLCIYSPFPNICSAPFHHFHELRISLDFVERSFHGGIEPDRLTDDQASVPGSRFSQFLKELT